MAVVLDHVAVISENDGENFAVDMTKLLDSGETITGTVLAVEAGKFTGYDDDGVAQFTASSDLTIANKGYNASAITVNGRSAAAGKAAQCSVSGQNAGYTYGITFTVTTTSTPARTLERVAMFEVK